MYVGCEKTEEQFFDHMKLLKMKWPAVRHGSAAEKALKKKLELVAIPHLVILDYKGNIVTRAGRADVSSDPDEALQKWRREAGP